VPRAQNFDPLVRHFNLRLCVCAAAQFFRDGGSNLDLYHAHGIRVRALNRYC